MKNKPILLGSDIILDNMGFCMDSDIILNNMRFYLKINYQ